LRLVELEAAASSAEVIKTAQNLAAKGFERRDRLASLDAELQRGTQTREAILARQAERRAAGRHEPFGVVAANFSGLPELTARLEAERLRFAAEETDIAAAALRQGFDSVDALRSWICPDAAAIQWEIVRRPRSRQNAAASSKRSKPKPSGWRRPAQPPNV
jgi:hypothetical protein